MQNNPANGAHAHFDRPEQPLRDDRQLRSASHLRDREGDHGQTLTHDHHHDHDHDHDQHHDSFAHGHDHGHGDHATGTNAAADGRERRIVFVACLTGAFFLVEIITGYVANSIALIADSFHMLSDIIALFIALYAIKLAKRTDRKPNFTFGYQRAEILGAFANSVFLLALCLTIIIEAIQRFVQPAEIDNPILVLIVGSLGLAMNIVGLFLFREGHGHSHGGSAGHSHAHGQAAQIPAGSSKAMKPILPTTNYSAKTRATIIAKADSMRNSHFSDESPLPSPAASHRRNPSFPASIKPDQSADHHQDSNEDDHKHTEYYSAIQEVVSDGEGDGHGHDEEKKSRRRYSHASSASSAHSHLHDPQNAGSEGHMNMKGIFLHLAGDALGSIGVIFSALLIKFGSGEWRFYMDPVVSLIISALIISSTLPLIKSAAFILLQGVPASVEIDRLKREILKLPGIVDVHEFHVWGLSDSKSVASVHIMVSEPVPWFPGSDSSGKFGHDDAPPPSYMEIATSVKRLLHSYGVHSTTVQPEFVRRAGSHGNGQRHANGSEKANHLHRGRGTSDETLPEAGSVVGDGRLEHGGHGDHVVVLSARAKASQHAPGPDNHQSAALMTVDVIVPVADSDGDNDDDVISESGDANDRITRTSVDSAANFAYGGSRECMLRCDEAICGEQVCCPPVSNAGDLRQRKKKSGDSLKKPPSPPGGLRGGADGRGWAVSAGADDTAWKSAEPGPSVVTNGTKDGGGAGGWQSRVGLGNFKRSAREAPHNGKSASGGGGDVLSV